MPGSMMHLHLAHRINSNSSTLFYIGNLAPDAVTNGKIKNITHFRDLSDRGQALAELALQTSLSDDFAQGVLLHLYLDWRWDIDIRDEFIKTVKGDWFKKYREELSYACSYSFHHTNWAKDLRDKMVLFDVSKYGKIPGATVEELRDFINRNHKWHNESNSEISTVFTPQLIDGFIRRIADEYTQWKR